MLSLGSLVSFVIHLVIAGLVLWLLWWLVQFINPPEPFRKVVQVVLAVAAVLVAIGLLLGLAGRPVIVP